MKRSDLTIGGVYAYTTLFEYPARKVKVIDLGGWVEQDRSDAHTYTVADGSTVTLRYVRPAESNDPPASRSVLVRHLTGRNEGKVEAVMPRHLVMPWDKYVAEKARRDEERAREQAERERRGAELDAKVREIAERIGIPGIDRLTRYGDHVLVKVDALLTYVRARETAEPGEQR